ncbi:MAG: hypothetical protein HN405_09875 [Planctomycetes bacterium]|jgi:YHS domain-containing protein|nr:hypothetical protein [Planctomycetota bacterium]MBT4028868.1 hypothetical protein [Planctomycetota bacterium]MBT7012317.1 hypothetical protein [Planctomycetota bacterium]MBT7318902.1 hypothetical protein [Planctomycetota bacterium]
MNLLLSLILTLVAQTTCPVTGDELANKDTFVDYEGQRIYLNCAECLPEFKAFPDKYIYLLYKKGQQLENIQSIDPVTGDALETREHSASFLNKTIYVNDPKSLKTVQKTPAKFFDILQGRKAQTKCAVMGGNIIPKNAFELRGSHVDQCCPPCEKKWRKTPDKYFAKLASANIVLQPSGKKCIVDAKADSKKVFWATLGSQRFHFSSEKAMAKFVRKPWKYLGMTPPKTDPKKAHAGHGKVDHSKH